MRISAIATTGVYCRPGCPAKPLEKNRTRYPSAIAAEAAGYRACLRCRPDREPEVLQPVGASDDVRRVLQAVSDGRLPAASVDTADDLRSIEFATVIGAPPAAIAAARQARFARRLLEQTDLPIRSIAAGVGVASSGSANRLLVEVFAFDAEELRRHRRAAERDDAARLDGAVAWTEPFWLPNDVEGTLGYLASRGIPGVVAAGVGRYRRVIGTSAGLAVAEVAAIGPLNADVGQLRVRIESDTVPSDPGELLAISASVRRLFALDSPLPMTLPIAHDPVLGAFVRAEPGRRLAGAWDRFETAIRIIVGQQVTVAAASTLTGRVVERCRTAAGSGPPVSRDLIAPFPSADEVAAVDLADIGMPRTRIATIGRFAEAVAAGDVDLATTAPLRDSTAMLCAVKGIGPWTAELMAARVFGDPDAFPPKDLGLMRAYEMMGGTDSVEAAAERWRPFRASAIAYLWSKA